MSFLGNSQISAVTNVTTKRPRPLKLGKIPEDPTFGRVLLWNNTDSKNSRGQIIQKMKNEVSDFYSTQKLYNDLHNKSSKKMFRNGKGIV